MALIIDQSAFPGCIVNALHEDLSLLDETVPVFRRPLRYTDENQCIGIFSTDVMPDQDSKEMRGMAFPGYSRPTITTYVIAIQTLIKHGDEESGIALHSYLTRLVRHRVEHSSNLALALERLVFTDLNLTERAQKWELQRSRHMSGEIPSGAFAYASSSEFHLETESR